MNFKKILMMVSILLFSVAGFAQSHWSVNLNGGLDKNFNKFYNENGYSKFEDGKTDFNGGLNIAYRMGKWLRFRIDFKYAQYSYGQKPLSATAITQSELNAFHMAVNPRFDFRVWTKNKFELFLSPGLCLEYLLDNDQVSTRSDGTKSYRNYISTDYNDKMKGLIAGALVKYNLTSHIGFTLSPDYTLFFDKLYDRNDGNLQRFSANIGVEWTL